MNHRQNAILNLLSNLTELAYLLYTSLRNFRHPLTLVLALTLVYGCKTTKEHTYNVSKFAYSLFHISIFYISINNASLSLIYNPKTCRKTIRSDVCTPMYTMMLMVGKELLLLGPNEFRVKKTSPRCTIATGSSSFVCTFSVCVASSIAKRATSQSQNKSKS